MEVNNDYNEKQHYNKQLLKEREQFKQQLNAKDQMFKDDTKQRFQLRCARVCLHVPHARARTIMSYPP